MRMAIPLTSKAKKLRVVIQCVMRTTAECLGESDAFKPWTASPSRYVDSGIESGAIITHHIRKEWAGRARVSDQAHLRCAVGVGVPKLCFLIAAILCERQ